MRVVALTWCNLESLPIIIVIITCHSLMIVIEYVDVVHHDFTSLIHLAAVASLFVQFSSLCCRVIFREFGRIRLDDIAF